MIPDRLTADQSEKYIVSIRFVPDGLSFWGYIPGEKDSFFLETFCFNPELPTVEALKMIFFANPVFSLPYHTFYIISVSGNYTLVPGAVLIETEKNRLYEFCFPKDKSARILTQSIPSLEMMLLYSMDRDIYAFLLRSLTNTQFIHSLSPLLVAWYNRSLAVYPKLMHVEVHTDSIDVLCFNQGELLFVNSYRYDNEHDIVYFILYIWKQTGLNQLEDYLTIGGYKPYSQKVLSIVGKYVQRTLFLKPVIKDYQVAIDQDVTLDMIALIESGV